MKKMVEKFTRKHGPFAMLEVIRKTCEAMAEERAEIGAECKMESEGYKCSAILHMSARAVKKCQNDIHRYKSCPCWVGGRQKWLG